MSQSLGERSTHGSTSTAKVNVALLPLRVIARKSNRHIYRKLSETQEPKSGFIKTVYINAGLRYISAKLIEINGFKEDKFC